jgi:hypothetical protein
METGEPKSDEDDRRLILVEQQIVQLASTAVETIFRTSGSSAANKGRRIERYFRDLNMVRTHVTLQFERTWENVGRMRLGLQPERPGVGAGCRSATGRRSFCRGEALLDGQVERGQAVAESVGVPGSVEQSSDRSLGRDGHGDLNPEMRG